MTTIASSQVPMTLEEALERCKHMIQVGSKSFSAAAQLFGREEKEAAIFLYGWCRFCDDLIDEAANQNDPKKLAERLDWLKQETRKAFRGEPTQHEVFIAFSFIVQKYQIPMHYPLELLEGMAMDIDKRRYESFEDLTLYCYRVAGVVGLMMSHIMGVSSSEALRNACHLGIAMQLTNIARDIKDDFEMGRIYLPIGWLREAKIPVDALLADRSRLVPVVTRLLESAEKYYRSGDEGLRYLSFRPACAVASARRVYAEIGREVLRRGSRAWDERVWIPKGRKIQVMLRGVLSVLASLPQRWLHPWNRRPIGIVWRHV